MRKHRLQDIVLGMLLMALVMGLAIPALAAVGGKTLDVAYMDIKLVVDGVPITPTDVNGNLVEPFAYQGTTYLPVRAVGEALGKEVTWDGNTNTVYVGEVPAGAIKTWVGVRDLGTELELMGMAKDLPHIAAAIKETNAHVLTGDKGHLAVRPKDAMTTTHIYLTYHSEDGLWIEGLQGYIGWDDGTGDGYKVIVRAILEDIISDANDIASIMNLLDEADRAWKAYRATEDGSQAEADALKNIEALAKVYELNTIKFDWTKQPGRVQLSVMRFLNK